jgi:hypothetical protein
VRSPAELAARARLQVLLEESRAAALALGPGAVAGNAVIQARVPPMLAATTRSRLRTLPRRGGFLRGTPEFEIRTDQIFAPHERSAKRWRSRSTRGRRVWRRPPTAARASPVT